MSKDYQREFVENFGKLFAAESARKHGESHNVDHMELDDDGEYVIVTFRNGYTKKICVACDSLSAMAYDIAKGLW